MCNYATQVTWPTDFSQRVEERFFFFNKIVFYYSYYCILMYGAKQMEMRTETLLEILLGINLKERLTTLFCYCETLSDL